MTGWPAEVRLTGDGLVLRGWTDDDVPAMVTLFDNPAVGRYTSLVTPFDKAAAVAYLERARRRHANGEAVQLAITEGDDQPLGEVLMFRENAAAEGIELGYSVGPAYRGRNLGSRALRLLTAYALELGLEPLTLQIEAENLASEAVAGKSGYRLSEQPPIHETSKGRRITLRVWQHQG
ncbi:GNAT family N-acetyltransferase [Amycolatopsis sp. H20-H5]|uniref:GNAT family N-acetyltransferase n=1 Tax=Amycolatopsis sp. H20-H5 TaxID=3046309 RepID=UPI002DBEA21D|nr:GNAT family N-acetyltransferase [Amycolatopsis sp. H20-H5]MEC3976653.1 GNAT family N-acetyltransferase [Amycolatopsis sp. H20-H5]